ncbi:MAG: lipid biosynthesis acyltransferase [Firmicutes bacterium]|nr:lipid biosynthesis acyltransferase [Bacillota bacterium]
MAYYVMKIFSRCMCALPFEVRYLLGNLLGNLFWCVVPAKRKRMAIANISHSLYLGEPEATQVAKKSTTRFGAMLMDVIAYPLLNQGNINEFVEIEGKEYLTDALALGRGVIVSTAHSGNWELFGAAMALNGFPVVGVAQKQTSASMDRFINEYRSMSGMQPVYKTGVRDMIRLLDDGKIIGLIMDQDAGRAGVFVNFFGEPASTPTGPAVLSRLKDSPIVPGFITSTEIGKHKIIFHKPLFIEKSADKEKDVFVVTEKLTRIIEDHIRQYPHEWFWLHNRWKHKPQNE